MQGLMSSYPLTLPLLFHRAERLFGEKTMTTLTATGKERTTYAEWAARTRRLAGALDGLGISADGRVATFAWNTSRHLELYFAAPCSGRVLHTLNIRLFPEQLSYVVDHAEDEVIFVDRSLVKVLWPLVDGFETVKTIVVMDDGAGDVPENGRILDYEELLADAEPAEFRIEDENQAAAMCYTSGTTGHPKGVVYSHRSSVLHSLGAMVADTVAVSERDVVMPVVPMFHANAWGLAHAGVMAGSAFAFPGPQMNPAAIAALMEDEKVTLAAGVPTIWMGALDELEGRDVSALRAILCGGSAVPQVLSEAYREKIGQPILHAWGMTETSPLGSVCRIKSTLTDRSEDELAHVRSTQGIVTPLMECRIVDHESGDALPWDGEARGELQVAGPWVAAGYYRDEEASAAQFTDDGWLRTGDVATISPEGYIRLVDRTKDLVKSGGEWISSVELENEIMAHPAVREAAVIGVPDEKWGERPLACVVAEDGEQLDADGLREFLSERVAKWWIPERVEFIDEVPKTSVGKFSKKTLRERFSGA
jgi:fatty-acyl-CoA synthase